MFRLFHLNYLKVSVLAQNIQKVCNQLFNIQSPSFIFKIIGYNFNTIQDIPKSRKGTVL